jgi:hypothetical protein
MLRCVDKITTWPLSWLTKEKWEGKARALDFYVQNQFKGRTRHILR